MSGYKRYPAYRESGVEWIGEIPAGWSHKMLKFVGNAVLGKMLTNDDKGDYSLKSYLRAKNILWEKVDADDINEMWFSAREMEQFRVRTNDLLISEGGEVGRTAIWNDELEECYLQNSVHKFTVGKGEEPRFHLYQLVTLGKLGYFDSVVNKVSIGHLTGEKLGPIPLVTPPPSEQTKIAAFLDRKTTQIDRLIEIKRRQIEVLKEERAAVINHAVTKGLNPAVKMKESGIEWIGEIPEGVELIPLKHFVPDVTVGIVVTPAKFYVNYGVPCLRSLNISSGKIVDSSIVYINDDSNDLHEKSKIYEGDIVVVRTGQTGVAAIVTREFDGANCIDLLIIRRSQNLLSEFLLYFINSNVSKVQVEIDSVGAIQAHYNTSTLKNLIVPSFTLKEQKDIVDRLDVLTSEIEQTISQAEKQIQLLQEYRTTLISDAVTGKIDVREEAA